MADQSESELHNAAKELGEAGGEVGGPARARKLSSQERSTIARKAAKARWAKEELKQRKPGQIEKANPHRKTLRKRLRRRKKPK